MVDIEMSITQYLFIAKCKLRIVEYKKRAWTKGLV